MSKITTYLSPSAIIGQLSRIWKIVLVGIIVSLGGVGLTVLVAQITDTPMRALAKDPADVKNYSSYVGMLSNWGVILWIAAGVICLFGAMILRHRKALGPEFRFLVVSGSFSLLLGIDDLYMFHDRVFPRVFHLPEAFFYLLYLLAFLLYLGFFIPRILKYDYLLFAAAFIFFVVSRGFYRLIPFFGDFYTTGDILKYFGIVFWLAFFYRAALHEVDALFKPVDNHPQAKN